MRKEESSFGRRKATGKRSDKNEKPARKPGRSSYGDHSNSKPFREKSGESDRDRTFHEKRSYQKDGDKSFRPKKSLGSDDKKPFERKKTWGSDEKKPYEKREGGESRPYRERKSWGGDDKKPFERKKTWGSDEKKPYEKREGGESRPYRERKSWGGDDKKPFERKKTWGSDEKKPYEKREGGESRPYRERKKWDSDDKKPYERKKSWDKDDGKPIEVKRTWDDGDEKPHRKSYIRETSDKKEGGSRRISRTEGKTSERRNEDGLIRLNKYLSNAGICSRREADELIQAGAVSVNGIIITELGHKISPEDKVQYGGETLQKEKFQYVLLNKPKGFITTLDDPQERKTVMNLIEDACKERIYPVGRLDRNTTGLLLFTNDGELTKKLTHPKYNIRKVYHVTLDKSLTHADLTAITEGIELEDGIVNVDEIAYVGESKKELGLEIHNGRNRIVRRIFEHLGYEVVKLDRVSFAGLTKKDLSRGRWRHLTPQEIIYLKMLKG